MAPPLPPGAPPIALSTGRSAPVQPKAALPPPHPTARAPVTAVHSEPVRRPLSGAGAEGATARPPWSGLSPHPLGPVTIVQLAKKSDKYKLKRSNPSSHAKQVSASNSFAHGHATKAQVKSPGKFDLAALHTASDSDIKKLVQREFNRFVKNQKNISEQTDAMLNILKIKEWAIKQNHRKQADLSGIPNIAGPKTMDQIFETNRTKIEKASDNLFDTMKTMQGSKLKEKHLKVLFRRSKIFHRATASGPHNVYNYGDQTDNAIVSSSIHPGFRLDPVTLERSPSPGTRTVFEFHSLFENSTLPFNSAGDKLVTKYDDHVDPTSVPVNFQTQMSHFDEHHTSIK